MDWTLGGLEGFDRLGYRLNYGLLCLAARMVRICLGMTGFITPGGHSTFPVMVRMIIQLHLLTSFAPGVTVRLLFCSHVNWVC
jgi:hypothetical protein